MNQDPFFAPCRRGSPPARAGLCVTVHARVFASRAILFEAHFKNKNKHKKQLLVSVGFTEVCKNGLRRAVQLLLF